MCKIVLNEFDLDLCFKRIGFQLNALEKNHILDKHIPSLQLILIELFSLEV